MSSSDTNYLTESKERVAAIIKEFNATQDGESGLTVRTFFWYDQPDPNYWTMRTGAVETEDQGQEEDTEQYNIYIRRVIGHLTEGMEGDREQRLDTLIPAFLQYMRARPQLNSEAYPDDQDDLIDSNIRLSNGFSVFVNSPGQQMGCEFTLTLVFQVKTEEAY